MTSSRRDLLLLAIFGSACSAAPLGEPVPVLSLRGESDGVRVLVGAESFARMALGGTERVHISELCAEGGRNVLRGLPSEAREGESVDHPEHTGLWTAHASVDGNDLWSGPGGPFATEHSLRIGRAGEAVVDARIEWRNAGGTVLCTERRTYTFWSTSVSRVVDVEHRLATSGRGLVLGDVREGFFALRLADAFRTTSDASTAHSFSSRGARNGEQWGRSARWVAAIAQIPGSLGSDEQVTVCVLDHPSNLGHPPIWNVRPWGFVAANPFARHAFEDDGHAAARPGLVLDGYETLTLRYRVIVCANELDHGEIDSLWTQFATNDVVR